MTIEGWDPLGTLAAEGARILAVARGADLSAPLPHMLRWKVRDVIAHLGGVHDWAARVVTSQSMDVPGFTKSKLDGGALCDWYEATLQALLTTLREADPSLRYPNFNPGSPNTLAFWHRRQPHETTIHRWDVEAGLGCTTPISDAVADDGIDEFLEVFATRRTGYELTSPLCLVTPGSDWTVTPSAVAGRVEFRQGAGRCAATVRGSAGEVLLCLWNRLAIADTDVTIDGDVGVVRSFIAGPPKRPAKPPTARR